MLRLALPKGRLLQATLDLLGECGMPFAFAGERDYSPTTTAPGISARVVKVRAIPQLLAMGNFQAGFCGQDLLAEAGHEEVVPLVDLGLNRVELVVAAPRTSRDILQNPPKRPIVIATEYENLAARWAMQRGLAHIIIQTWGSTEGYAPDDADIVFDNSETGATLEANGLVVIDRLMTSTTWFAANREAAGTAAVQELTAALRKQARGTQ